MGASYPEHPAVQKLEHGFHEQGKLDSLSPERKGLSECSSPREEQDLDVHYLLVFAVAYLHLLTAEQLLGLHLKASTSMHVLYRESNTDVENATR